MEKMVSLSERSWLQRLKLGLKIHWRLYLFILPTFLFIGTFSYYPAVSGIYHAFFRWDGHLINEYIGLGNFREILTSDRLFWISCKNLLYFIVAAFVKMIPPIVISVVMFRLSNKRAQYLYRISFVVPVVIPGMVGMLVWKFIYNYEFGLLNRMFMMLGLADWQQNWLGDPGIAIWSLIFLGFPWISTIGVLIYLAGLQGISESIFEAAELDGVGPFQRFWHIELPLIVAQIRLNVILLMIGTIQAYGLQLLLTQGGPGDSTLVPGLHMYQSAFEYGRYGYASAIGVVLFIIILALTYINMKLIRPREKS